MIRVLDAGTLTLVQDLGRHGYASFGVSPSGAADRGAFRLANRLVGNPEETAAFELTLGGLTVELGSWTTLALAGAECSLHVDGAEVGMRAPVTAAPHSVVRVGLPRRGLRSYLAVRGGIDARRVMGSVASDTLAGIGPPAVRAGDSYAVGDVATSWPNVDSAASGRPEESPVLEVLRSRPTRWFGDAALAALESGDYQVAPESSRTAVRLVGPHLDRLSPAEFPPEGLVPGAIQVPPSGQPLVFLADHPVTGGYPVIGVLTDRSCDLAAQLRPGQRMRFRVRRNAAG